MAKNFKIVIRRNTDNLHLKLIGDFDGSSACEVINIMAQKGPEKGTIVIHTSSLSSVHPFGKDLFRERLKSYNKSTKNITLTGNHATQLAFNGSKMC